MARKKGVLSKAREAPKDFQKVKNKVGKKKKAPLNDTKIDFRVKQVQVPRQAALNEKDEEVTHRRLGLPELLSHLQHHSPKVRRDALRGLQELCTEHNHILDKNLARIIEATTVVVIDNYAEVRQAFRSFQTFLLEVLPRGGLTAFANSLALQVRSALSHVSSEVRGDGLLLLDLYVARLGESQVLTQDEAFHVIKILCQMSTHGDMVLSCLHKLLQPPPAAVAELPSVASTGACLVPGTAGTLQPVQFSLQAALDGRLQHASGAEPQVPGEKPASEMVVDSPVWAFCLRMWLQAGELPTGLVNTGNHATSEELGKPGWTKLRCAAVLERALLGALKGASRGIALRPSGTQVATLSGIIGRGEWPLHVETNGTYRVLADSVNVSMARVCALLVAGGAPMDAPKRGMAQLVSAVLSFLQNFATFASRAAGGSASGLGAATATAAAAGNTSSEVRLLSGAAAVASVLQSLDLLWSCSPAATVGDAAGMRSGLLLNASDLDCLVCTTARLVVGDENVEEASVPAILSVPLAASLLGLRPSTTAVVPAAVRAAWPQALVAVGEPCLAKVIEASQPGTAVAWVKAWPKLLWYLGTSDPTLSTFLLALLLELAKHAMQPGGLHQQLFGQVCPLLVPFLVGRPGADWELEPPLLAMLPASPEGPQGLAALLLQHFPRLREPLLALLARLVRRWSDVGSAGGWEASTAAAPPRLGTECCELILEAVLRGPGGRSAQLLQTRLQAALTVLCAAPCKEPAADRAEGAEHAALRFADLVGDWLMSDAIAGSGGPELADVVDLGYDDRRRLAFQSLAWPLCTRVFAAAPALASRALCFLFFCAARLPRSETAAPAADLGWHPFLAGLFNEILVTGGGRALVMNWAMPGAASAVGAGTGCSPVTLPLPLCDANRCGGLPMAGGLLDALRCLARLLTSLWMCVVPSSQRAGAYELLAKLCTQHLGSLQQQASVSGSVDREQHAVAFSSSSMLLAEAIAYRNEHSLPKEGWGSLAADLFDDRSLVSCTAEALRERLCRALQLPGGRCLPLPGMAALEAMLPML